MAVEILPPKVDLADGSTARQSREELKLLAYLDSLYEEGERARDRIAPKSERDRDLKLYRGKVGPKDQKDVYFAANFVQAFVDRMVQSLTDARPNLRVDSRKAGLKKVALVSKKVVDAVWEEAKVQRRTYKMALNAAITRSAGMYTGYDPTTDEITLETLKISQVVMDPTVDEASQLGRGEYTFIQRVRPVNELAYKFPGRGGLVKPDATVSMDAATQAKRGVLSPLTDLLENQIKGGDALGRARVWECLLVDRQRLPNGQRMFPTFRQIFRTRDRLLWDQPLPFWDGLNPVDWFDWITDPEHPWGMSAPDLIMHLQLAFNQLGDGLVENQLLSNFLTVIADHDALDTKTWNKLQAISSSLILRKRNRNSQAPTVVPPAPFGADKLSIMHRIFTVAQLLTGVTDVTLGENPGSLQSGVAIEGLQDSANLGTRSRASRLEDFFASVGQKLLSRIWQFFPSDRVVSLVGPTGEAMDYVIKRSEFFLDDDNRPLDEAERREALKWQRFIVHPGSSLPGARVRRGQLIKDLVLLGAASRKMVLEAADFPNPTEMLEEAKAEMKEFAAAGWQPPAQSKSGK